MKQGLASSNRTTDLKAGSWTLVGPTGGHGVGSGKDKVSLRFSKQCKSGLEPQEKLICEMRPGFSGLPQEPERIPACAGQLDYVATHDFIKKKKTLDGDLITWPQCRDFWANSVGSAFFCVCFQS